MQCGILDWVLKQKKDIYEQTAEIQIRSNTPEGFCTTWNALLLEAAWLAPSLLRSLLKCHLHQLTPLLPPLRYYYLTLYFSPRH